eukprot:9471027-Pyramimonas_sp.AAC.1
MRMSSFCLFCKKNSMTRLNFASSHANCSHSLALTPCLTTLGGKSSAERTNARTSVFFLAKRCPKLSAPHTLCICPTESLSCSWSLASSSCSSSPSSDAPDKPRFASSSGSAGIGPPAQAVTKARYLAPTSWLVSV